MRAITKPRNWISRYNLELVVTGRARRAATADADAGSRGPDGFCCGTYNAPSIPLLHIYLHFTHFFSCYQIELDFSRRQFNRRTCAWNSQKWKIKSNTILTTYLLSLEHYQHMPYVWKR